MSGHCDGDEIDQAITRRDPTLSVILPSGGGRPAQLRRQLAAIVPQLHDRDELVMLCDGATDETLSIMYEVTHARKYLASNHIRSGVCAAYNQLGGMASGDWILGAADDDEVQDGAIDRWREAVNRWPDARVMFGGIIGWPLMGWGSQTDYVYPHQWPHIWRTCGGMRTHGAAAFLRRDTWGPGYLPELEWTADWWQTFVPALRYGAVYLAGWISRVNFSAESYSANHQNDERYNAVVRRLRPIWADPALNDIRWLLDDFAALTGHLEERQPRPPEPIGRIMSGRLPARLVRVVTGGRQW